MKEVGSLSPVHRGQIPLEAVICEIKFHADNNHRVRLAEMDDGDPSRQHPTVKVIIVTQSQFLLVHVTEGHHLGLVGREQ